MKVNNNHFEIAANKIDIQRSTFKRDTQHKTSGNLGEIIPFYIEEVLPGDTIKLKTNTFIRTGTLIAPLMDNIYYDVYYFFVPNRIIWNHFKQFMGENDKSAWTQTDIYTIPMQTLTGEDCKKFKSGTTLFNYLTKSTPSGNETQYKKNIQINELPLRAYYFICNEWFRNENTKAPTLFTKEDAENTNIRYTDKPYIANKFKDYFTSALPAPQKGNSVSLILGETAPLTTINTDYAIQNPKFYSDYITPQTNKAAYIGSGQNGILQVDNTNTFASDGNDSKVNKTNIAVDLSEAVSATINAQRLAFQTQKFLERDARGGTRYDEITKAHFGVYTSAEKIDIPEYLTGHRFAINVDQVLQTAESQNASGELKSPLGTTAGYSRTFDGGTTFTKSFVEHGYILGVAVMRQEETYTTAINKLFLRKNKLDFYWPEFANIGEQPILSDEIDLILAHNDDAVGNVFGYQEAWAEYRYSPSGCSGLLNPNTTNSLNYWILANDDLAPDESINKQFTDANKKNLNRALAATSEATGCQYIVDFYTQSTWTRPMPIYSIPGLIDHH